MEPSPILTLPGKSSLQAKGRSVRGLRGRSKILLEIVKRSDAQKGFQILPHRWIVERTFAWLGRYRRLSKDYEYLPETSEAFIKIAMIHLMLRRLAQHSEGF